MQKVVIDVFDLSNNRIDEYKRRGALKDYDIIYHEDILIDLLNAWRGLYNDNRKTYHIYKPSELNMIMYNTIVSLFNTYYLTIDVSKKYNNVITASANNKFIIWRHYDTDVINIPNTTIKTVLICPPSNIQDRQALEKDYNYVYSSVRDFIKDINNIVIAALSQQPSQPTQITTLSEPIPYIKQRLDTNTLLQSTQEFNSSATMLDELENPNGLQHEPAGECFSQLVSEVVANDEVVEHAIKPESQHINQQEATNDKPTISSFALGKKGEEYITDMINKVRPMYSVHIVASTGHLADIIADDEERNIKYVIEVKNKQTITNADLIKFDSDVKSAISNNPNWFVVGVFMSLNTDKITTIGTSFRLTTDNKIYMPMSYVNKECLDAMFTVMTSYKTIYTSLNMKATTELPENIIRLLDSLKNEYTDIEATEKKYNDIIDRNSENSKTIMELKASLSIKRRFIEQINTICYNTIPLAENRIKNEEENRLRTYINSLKRKSLLNKTNIIQSFPILQNILGSMTKDDIWAKYHD